jgi:glucuronoarabinoxylan endo-1,4-beta-xylanase
MRHFIFAAIFALGLPGYAQVCTVNWTNVHQRIDGFGASSAWRSTWSDAQADMFFSTNTGIGLSLLRNHITAASSTSASATPSTSEWSIMQKAQARGAKVWSAPWTPASGFKSNNGPNGGNYLGSGATVTNLNYASQLANYVYSMKITYGVNLYAISVQNEPDANVTTYEACKWTGQQIHDFTTNLYNALVAKGMGSTKIIIPESQNWSSNPGLYTPTLNDPTAAADVSIIANHNYVANNQVGDTTTPAALSTSGKASWETEVSQIGGSYDGSINNAIYWAGRIHLFMTAAQANAWHYWWLISQNSDNEGLTDTSGNPAKRMYVLGQWSRFVRPGYYRIGATTTGTALISAYNNTSSSSSNFAIVAVNTNTSTAISQTFNLTNFPTVSSVTPWITSATLSLANQTPVTVSGSSFTYTLPALSVVTFVGQQQTNTAPTLAPVGNQVINAGVTLMVTNAATDADQPLQTLTFSLLNAPTNATLTPLNNTNAVFTWRPLVSQASTTNTITLKVADNGTPNLSATNSFTVKVNPLAQPVVSSISVSGGQVSLVATGAVGPDYTLWASTNLTSWQVLFTSNSPVTPVTLVDTNFNAHPVRFYRIQLGP